jgi:hypothetical protein
MMHMKTEFLISAARTSALERAIETIDGKPISDSSWIALWDRDADALCSYLRPACVGGVAACALVSDWSYVL